MMLKSVAQNAGIDKPINPHHFRHSRATDLAKKLTEAQLCQYMGWIQSSKEAATYVHLSGRDMDKAILTLHGLAEEETQAFGWEWNDFKRALRDIDREAF